MADKATTAVELYDRALFPMLAAQDPEEVTARLAGRIFQAQTMDDIFGIMEGTLSKDLVDVPLDIRGVTWQPYESDRGVTPLAIVDAVNIDTGEVVQFATTSTVLVASLRQAEIIGAIPFATKIKSRKTNSGNYALNFSKA
jgi:hypothetical protein